MPLAIALLLGASSADADPRAIMGSGNFDLQYNSEFDRQFQILNANGVQMCRINAYPGDYWNGSQAVTPANMDAAILKAKSYGITPMILFSYYAFNLDQAGITLGGTAKWQAVGQAYANRYRPNSPWLVSQGISNWGVSIYTAFNEPDLGANNSPAHGALPATSSASNVGVFGGNYRDNLAALSDGIKGVDSSLKVINGGFMAQNAFRDYTCGGYATAIADLFNNGKLDGLNLHTYNDAQFAPLQGEANGANTEWAAFRQFLKVKQRVGITRDIDFYTDEFNYKNVDTWGGTYDENRTAKNLFTVIWQNLGAVKNDGATNATKMALLWSLFPVESTYTTSESYSPYVPRAAAKTYKFVADQTAGTEFQSLDPFGKGEWTLAGNGKKIWVWTNYLGYTNRYNTAWTVTGIPTNTGQLKVYGWDGFNGARQTINLSAGQTSATISGLATGETYMVVSVPGTPTGGNITSNLVARFPADNTAGTTLSEVTAGNNASMLGGYSWNPSGRIGGALTLSGSSGYAAMSQGFTAQFGNTITYACWFKTSTRGALVGEQNANTWQTPSAYSPILYVDTAGKLRGGFYNGSVNNLVSGATVTDNNWHHAALTSTGSVQKLYLDGVLQGTWNGNVNRGAANVSQWGTAYAGGWPQSVNGWMYFSGSLDEMRIYNRALSDADVALLANANPTFAASSAPVGSEGAAQAFDNSNSTKWLGNFSANNTWLSYAYGNNAPTVVKRYQITSANDEPTRDPKSWKLQGWNGSSWVDLNTQTGQSFSGRFVTNTYTLTNTTAYSSYRLLFSENGGSSLIQLAEFKLLLS